MIVYKGADTNIPLDLTKVLASVSLDDANNAEEIIALIKLNGAELKSYKLPSEVGFGAITIDLEDPKKIYLVATATDTIANGWTNNGVADIEVKITTESDKIGISDAYTNHITIKDTLVRSK